MLRTVLVIMGAAFILIGLVGFVSDNFAGTHLTLLHNLIHLVSGAASLYFGLKASRPAAKIFALAFGAMYMALAVAGYTFGMTATTTLPPATAEGYNEHMFRIIPGVFELGTTDHILHFVIGAVFLIAAAMTRANLVKYTEGNPE
ncbi:MAG: hypothetical protein H0U87_04155 [Acidobacteria bacterium]|nr:hypothetical protein [Acidobacteriota bacterium]